MKKSLISLIILFSLLVIPSLTFAQDVGAGYAENSGLTTRDIRDVTISLIRVVLGFLAIVATIIIIYGGFKWMTAAGNEEKVTEARKLLVAGIIGLIIIIAAFAIVTFVLQRTMEAMNGGI